MKRLMMSLFFSFLLVSSLVLGACAPKPTPKPTPTPTPTPAPTPTPTPQPWPKKISIAPGRAGGATYILAAGMAAIVKKYVPGLDVIVESTSGFDESMALLENKQVEMIATSTAYNYWAPRGLELWKKSVSLRVMNGSGPSTIFYIFTLPGSPIKSIPDIRGKKVAGQTQSVSHVIILNAVFKAYGMTEADVKMLSYTTFDDCARMVKEGIADVGIMLTAIPTPALTDLATTKGIAFIPLDKAEAIAREVKISDAGVIQAGLYPGVNVDIPAVLGSMAWDVLPALPESLVYEMLKAVYEHPEEFYAVHPSAKTAWRLDQALSSWNAPYHPGAIKYYKEKGLWTKDMDAKQKALEEEFKKLGI